MEKDLSPKETQPVASITASLWAHFKLGRTGERTGEQNGDCPAFPFPLPQYVFITSVGVLQREREAHTHPELLLVRDSLSVCPCLSFVCLCCEPWNSGVGEGGPSIALRMLTVLLLLGSVLG